MASVPVLVQNLCSCIMADMEKREEEARRTAPFSLPGHLYPVCFSDRAAVKGHLFRIAFELLLLRRREWHARWQSPLSSESRCLAKSYLLHQQGRHEAATRLSQAIASLTRGLGDSALPILNLLSILADVGGGSFEEVRERRGRRATQ